jgi:hypothetical protein
MLLVRPFLTEYPQSLSFRHPPLYRRIRPDPSFERPCSNFVRVISCSLTDMRLTNYPCRLLFNDSYAVFSISKLNKSSLKPERIGSATDPVYVLYHGGFAYHVHNGHTVRDLGCII